jgi:hypothetical protein
VEPGSSLGKSAAPGATNAKRGYHGLCLTLAMESKIRITAHKDISWDIHIILLGVFTVKVKEKNGTKAVEPITVLVAR